MDRVKAHAVVLDEPPRGEWTGVALRYEPPACAHFETTGMVAPETIGAKARRSVLVLASRFPPVASVGAIRVRKFVKYLPDFGWDPVVITGAMRTARPGAHEARRAVDTESLADVPASVPVHRLSPVPDNWPGFVTRSLARTLARVTWPLGLCEASWSGMLKWRVQRVHDRLCFPDRGIWRLPSAVGAALALHRTHCFDAVFSSGMPFSDHLIAWVVSHLLRRPWIADFRDPWVEYIHWKQWQSGAGRMLTRRCEAAVIRRAAHVISVNDHMTARFTQRYRRATAGKFVTIANGFDPDDFAAPGEQAPGTHFRLLYAGSLYETRSPEWVLTAFRRFIHETPGSAAHARLDFAGRPGPYQSEMNRAEDGGTIRYLGLLPHRKAMAEMARADANLIILPDVPGSEADTTAKLYECLGCGRAVLATVPLAGSAAQELRGHGGVWLCAPRDVEAIRRAISEMYALWLAGRLPAARPGESLSTMTRRGQARRLAGLFDAAVGAGVKELTP